MDEHKASGLLETCLHEYAKLKDEQIQRIGFRDNMIYVTLVAVGAVAAFAVSDKNYVPVLLIVPWVCLVLGWTYLVNDEKISAIGQYIRLTLVETLRAQLPPVSESELLGWEIAHREDKRRKERKRFQLVVDELTFCLSGLVAILLFWVHSPTAGLPWLAISILELAFLLFLGYQMIVYADLRSGR